MLTALVVAAPAAGQGTIPDRTTAGAIPNRTAASPIPLRAGAIGDPATGASSIYRNMQGRFMGMGQQVVNRTPDNAEGVYWRMYNANKARERQVYLGMRDVWVDGQSMLNPVIRERLRQERELQMQRERDRLAEETAELKWRQDVRNRVDQKDGTAVSFPGADMLKHPTRRVIEAEPAPAAMAAGGAPEAAPVGINAPAAPAYPVPALPAAMSAMVPFPAPEGYDYASSSSVPTQSYSDPSPIPRSLYGPLGGYWNHMARFPNFHQRSPGFYERSPNLPERAPNRPDRDPLKRDR
jgi:hypothetical protein